MCFRTNIKNIFITISCIVFFIVSLIASPTFSTELTYERAVINPYDGRKRNGDWLGAWITLIDVQIGGVNALKRNVSFGISATYPNKPVWSFEFSSLRTFRDMPSYLSNSKFHNRLGHRVFLGKMNRAEIRRLNSALTEQDRLIFRGICGALEDRQNIIDLVDGLKNIKPNSFSDYVDDKFNKYWAGSTRVNEIIKIAKNCNAAISNNSSDRVAFVSKSDLEEMLSQNKNQSNKRATNQKLPDKLCGFEVIRSGMGRGVVLDKNLLSQIQRGLAKRNLYNGVIDGIFGSGSCKAFRKWVECENVGQKTISEFSLAKLTTSNPSGRELTCYDGNTKDGIAKRKPICGYEFSSSKFTWGAKERRQLQMGLKNRGLYSGGIDGVIGKSSCLGFAKFMEKEAKSKIFNLNALAKVMEKPSSAALALYNEVTYNNELDDLTYSLKVEPFDNSLELGGIDQSSGAWVYLNNIKRDGSPITGFSKYAFEYSGNYQTDYVDIGFNETRSNLKIVPNLYWNWKYIRWPGNHAFVDGDSLQNGQFRKIFEALTVNEQKMIAEVCDLMSKSKFTSEVIQQAVKNTSQNFYLNKGKYQSLWRHQKISERLNKLGIECAKNFIPSPKIKKSVASVVVAEAESKASNTVAVVKDGADVAPKELELVKKPDAVIVVADSISTSIIKTAKTTTLSLLAQGSSLETSLMSKSIFGMANQVKIDINFDTSKGSPTLNFVVTEADTKVNLHFYDNETKNREFAAGLPELVLDEKSKNSAAFSIQMRDSGISNVDSGDFGKLLTQMPRVDRIMLSALCRHIERITSSDEGFEAQLDSSDDKAVFRASFFSNAQVRDVVNELAAQCVTEVRSIGAVEASFNVLSATPVCTANQIDGLASLDEQIATEQESLLGITDQIIQLQSQRPLFQFKECKTYSNDVASTSKRLESLQAEMIKLELLAEEVTDDLDAGRNLTARLGYLKTPTDICLVENKALRADVNKYLLKLAPVFVGVQCPDPDDAPKNPVQIVVKEINAEILELLEVHISPDGIAELEAERDNKLQELRDFMARLEAFEQSKASPQEIQAQINKNTSLEQTIDEIEARSLSLENEIRDLNGVLVDNAGMIEGIDILNQRLVELSAEKDSRQSVLDEAKSTALAAQAVISQRDLEISKLEAQISDLDIQMEAASSTAGNLVEEVVQLGQDIAERTERVATLEASVSEAQSFVDNANDAIGQKSQEVSKLDVELSKKVADATILANSVSKLVPQADAAETTVEDMLNSLKTKFVPIGQYEDQATRLNELTQAVTERTKLIQELRSDLASIEQEEQLFIKMCLADAQCKAAMGERLGVDQ